MMNQTAAHTPNVVTEGWELGQGDTRKPQARPKSQQNHTHLRRFVG
jgi:hypothetical protein